MNDETKDLAARHAAVLRLLDRPRLIEQITAARLAELIYEGPLTGTTSQIADQLVDLLTLQLPGVPVRLDVGLVVFGAVSVWGTSGEAQVTAPFVRLLGAAELEGGRRVMLSAAWVYGGWALYTPVLGP